MFSHSHLVVPSSSTMFKWHPIRALHQWFISMCQTYKIHIRVLDCTLIGFFFFFEDLMEMCLKSVLGFGWKLGYCLRGNFVHKTLEDWTDLLNV